MQLDRDEVLVDIGSKSEGIIPNKELSSLGDAERKALSSGDTVLVFVVQPENADGHAVLSIDRARQEKSWRVLQQKYEANEVIEAIVKNYNKGGLLVDLDGVRGFVPASQVTEIRGGDEASKQGDMARLIGMSDPPQGDRDQPPPQPPDPLRAAGDPGAARRDEGAADRYAQGGRGPQGSRLQHLRLRRLRGHRRRGRTRPSLRTLVEPRAPPERGAARSAKRSRSMSSASTRTSARSPSR